jgi:hypothetical protein
MQSIVSRMLVLLVTFSMAGAALAEETTSGDTRYLDDRFSLRLIGGLVDLSTDVAAGRSLGALIDLEDVLGFDESISSFGFTGFWRFTKSGKNALRVRYANFDRDASTAVEAFVPIFDVNFFGELDSEFVNRIFTLEYQYSFVNNSKTEAGFSVGLATYNYELTLSGLVIVDDNMEEASFRSENVGVVAPVPSFGFFINHAFRKDLIFELSTSFIDLEIGEHNGRIFNSWGHLTWYFSQHFGVGLGLSASDVVYDKQGSERIKVELRQSAVVFSLAAVF